MPHFSWRGVTITGAFKRGTLFAVSPDHVDQLLLRRGIACTYIKSRKSFLVMRRIQYADQSALLHQLATLLHAGILVPDAFLLIAEYSTHPALQEYMYQSAEALKAGKSLRDALSHNSPFNTLIMHLLHIGHESGDLVKAVEVAAHYVEMQKTFYAQVRNALFMPCITGLFVIALIWSMFAFLLPHIATIFTSFQNELPPTTQILMRMSEYARNVYVIGGLFFSIMLLILLCIYIKRSSRLFDVYTLKIPCIGNLLRERLVVISLRSLASLVRSGMRLHAALEIVHDSISHHVLKEDLAHISTEVASGASLSDACISASGNIFSSETVAMMRIGEETNALAEMLETSAQTRQEYLSKQLARLSMLIQPILIVILALVVMMLIIAIYLPIMNLADLV